MWTAPWQALSDVTALWRLLSYVRPVDARPQPAGHDDIRVPGFSSAPRAQDAGRGSECPGLRFAGSSSPHFALPNVAAVSGETCSIACRYSGAIGASERKSSPVVMIAQAMRANLLASATVTSRAGRRCKSLLVQTARGSVLLWSQRKLAVAPRTRRRRRYGLPCLVILPSLSFPPLEFCRGTRPSHAAKSRPERNMEGSGTCAARAALISANARDGFERLGRRALALPGLDLLVD